MMVDRTQDEWALVCTARQGDKEALQVLLRRNWAWVKALVYSVLAGSSSGLRAGDALIAATATENNLTLLSGNAKHFKPIRGLRLRIFTP